MYNCIFTGHCIHPVCDQSCPDWVETAYLLERNKIPMTSDVFRANPADIQKCNTILDEVFNQSQNLSVVQTKQNTNEVSNLITYCGICRHWKGNQLKCSVFNLRLFQYLEDIRKTWNNGGYESEELEYTKLFTKNSKVLIISNIDYINFKNFECQTLLGLIQERSIDSEKSTIIVAPPLSSLMGDGGFYQTLMNIMGKARVDYDNKH